MSCPYSPALAGLDLVQFDCADRRDAEGQKALFTEDTQFVVYMEGPDTKPSQELHGRQALTPVFEDLNRYQATMHFNGQSTIGSTATRPRARSCCIAHHLYAEEGTRMLMVAWCLAFR